jgi:hypothetical protein
VRGVCEKPRVKCSECPNQAFIPMSDQVVLDEERIDPAHVTALEVIEREETPPAPAQPRAEPTVEYDEDAFADFDASP